MTRLKLLILPILLVFAGCQSVPVTDITIPLPDGRVVRIKAPKDVEIEGLKVGDWEIKSYKARMNPDVMSASNASNLQQMAGFAAILEKGFLMGQGMGPGFSELGAPAVPPLGRAGPVIASVAGAHLAAFEGPGGQLFLIPTNLITRVQRWTNAPAQ